MLIRHHLFEEWMTEEDFQCRKQFYQATARVGSTGIDGISDYLSATTNSGIWDDPNSEWFTFIGQELEEIGCNIQDMEGKCLTNDQNYDIMVHEDNENS